MTIFKREITSRDLLIRLYGLPDKRPHIDDLQKKGIDVRRAMAYEKHQTVEWVKESFGKEWAGECDVAFGNSPVSCFIATQNNNIVRRLG